MNHALPSLAAPFALVLAAEARLQEPAGHALPTADPAVTSRELHHHVAFLASDELRGRAAGTPDALRAAHYLARALEAAGLRPAGDGESFLQAVPLVRWVHAAVPRLALVLTGGERVEAVPGVDFSLFISGEPRSTGPLELLTIRSAEDLPTGADLSRALYLAGTTRERREWLDARGMDGSGWGLSLRAGSRDAGRPAGKPRSRLRRRSARDARGTISVTLRGYLAEALEEGDVRTLELICDFEREEVDDYNVIGRIDGVGTTDRPELASEAIVFTAHYDHIGVRDPNPENPGADTVFNGADDDASGTAAVLEIAQAMASADPPVRTLLFMLAAGEEQGLLGTHHYLEHPSIPLERTVANLNFEMLGRPDEAAGGKGKLWLTGFERTSLGPAFQEAGFDLVPDPHLEQNFFQRSDNYAFAVRGIVAQTLSSYDLHEDYHQPSDETDTLDFEHMEAAVRAALAGSRLLAGGELSPEWLPGGKPVERR